MATNHEPETLAAEKRVEIMHGGLLPRRAELVREVQVLLPADDRIVGAAVGDIGGFALVCRELYARVRGVAGTVEGDRHLPPEQEGDGRKLCILRLVDDIHVICEAEVLEAPARDEMIHHEGGHVIEGRLGLDLRAGMALIEGRIRFAERDALAAARWRHDALEIGIGELAQDEVIHIVKGVDAEGHIAPPVQIFIDICHVTPPVACIGLSF